ncbi:MAG: radical SAM family heme chaperone HemW [Chloracidobacterium sp.]|nr:radical SAM family heme chaperone HemW [Chloracidobacterium sp.]
MPAGIYVHIPFCKSRCSYCDFATDVYRDAAIVDTYVDALCSEIRNFTSEIPGDADTVYFGGGTPSLLKAGQVKWILESLHTKFDLTDDVEITMEMNPATVTAETLDGYRQLGINRASFGVQTFDDKALKLLARGHDANDARNTFSMLRDAGFENISFDLIAGLPGQTLEQWRANLDEAIQISPEHISLYLLEIHSGTPLAEQISSGRQPRPDDDVAGEMYEVISDRLAASGYEQYEISNFSKPGFPSSHNTKYWLLDPVFGFGVSAHSFDGRERYANERDTAKYVEIIEQNGSAEVLRETIDVASEAVFLGLRMEDGIDLADYRKEFDIDLIAKHREDIERLIDTDLLTIVDGRLRLTRRGKLLSNEVFAVFV